MKPTKMILTLFRATQSKVSFRDPSPPPQGNFMVLFYSILPFPPKACGKLPQLPPPPPWPTCLFAVSIQVVVIFTLHGEFLVVSKYFSALERASIILGTSEKPEKKYTYKLLYKLTIQEGTSVYYQRLRPMV